MMTRLGWITCVALLTACAAERTDVDRNNGEFTAAAQSWVGADVNDMIRVWGKPTSQSSASPGKEGLVHWSVLGYRGGSAGSSPAGSRCIVDAYTAADGTISRVEVTSRGCDEKFASRMHLLRRP